MSVDTIRRYVKTIVVLCTSVCGFFGILPLDSYASPASSQPRIVPAYGAKVSIAARRVFSAKSDDLEIPMDEPTPTPTFVELKQVTLSNTASGPVSDAAEALIDMDIPMAPETAATPTQQVEKPEKVEPRTEGPKEEPTATPETVSTSSVETDTPTAMATPTHVVEVEKTEATPVKTLAPEKSRNVLPGKRIGLSPEWFEYLIGAGYLVPSSSHIPNFGNIVESSLKDDLVAVGMHLVIHQTSKETAKIGDRLMVYRTTDPYSDPETDQPLGLYVKNLGVLKITKTEPHYVQADVLKVYGQFKKTDSVKSFEDELDRWKQSRRRKPLPADPIECSIAGFPNGLERGIMNDSLVLSAGEDQGVVAGMDFELQKPVEVAVGKTVWMKVGKARVFFVGGKYSMAKVVWNQDLILLGFRAQYQP